MWYTERFQLPVAENREFSASSSQPSAIFELLTL